MLNSLTMYCSLYSVKMFHLLAMYLSRFPRWPFGREQQCYLVETFSIFSGVFCWFRRNLYVCLYCSLIIYCQFVPSYSRKQPLRTTLCGYRSTFQYIFLCVLCCYNVYFTCCHPFMHCEDFLTRGDCMYLVEKDSCSETLPTNTY